VGNGYEVDTNSLNDHIEKVRNIAARLDTAASAAQKVDIGGPETYGLLFSALFTTALDAFHGNSATLVGSIAEMTHSYADALSGQKQDYEDLEAQNKKMFKET
jgi:hypothetical protein